MGNIEKQHKSEHIIGGLLQTSFNWNNEGVSNYIRSFIWDVITHPCTNRVTLI